MIERAWFGPADCTHGHDALGIVSYPGRVHAIVRDSEQQHAVHLELAGDAAFEDGLIRLADLDADGSPEIVLVAASRLDGAAVSVLGVERQDGAPVLLERARSPSVGPGRWLNLLPAPPIDALLDPLPYRASVEHCSEQVFPYRLRCAWPIPRAHLYRSSRVVRASIPTFFQKAPSSGQPSRDVAIREA